MRHVRFSKEEELKAHLRKVHKLQFCKICLKSRIVFPWEQKLFGDYEISQHIQFGSGREIPHHPLCLFCRIRFFDEAELRGHLESKHYFCNFCGREEALNLYYSDFKVLRTHFQKHHYVCHDDLCRNNRFSVFKMQYELQVHIQNVHMNSRKGSVQLQLQPPGQKEGVVNTEAVDFSGQFNVQTLQPQANVQHPEPKKNYVVKRKLLTVINYKSLPKRPAPEIIYELRVALNNEDALFRQLKQATVQFNKDEIPPSALFSVFHGLFQERTEFLFPSLIATLSSPTKQEKLHLVYTEYVEQKNNLSADGRCTNVFAECRSDSGTIKALRDLLFEELKKRKADAPEEPLFIEEEHLRQMAAVIDTLAPSQLRSLSLIMNFSVSNATRKTIVDMLNKANNANFVVTLTTKYEWHFLSQLSTQQLYIVFKYSDLALAKVKGLPFRDEPRFISNWKEDEQTEETESGWSAAILGNRPKAPVYNEDEYPALTTAPLRNSEAVPPAEPWVLQEEVKTHTPAMIFPALSEGNPRENHPGNSWSNFGVQNSVVSRTTANRTDINLANLLHNAVVKPNKKKTKQKPTDFPTDDFPALS